MKQVNIILQHKNNNLVTISANATVYEALEVMMAHNISAMLITDDTQLTGIFTERDYARKVVLKGKSSKETLIAEVMTANPIVINPKDSLDYCMGLMTDKHIRHLPVVENGKLSGMLSIGDVVKFIIEDQKQTIKDLETYISS